MGEMSFLYKTGPKLGERYSLELGEALFQVAGTLYQGEDYAHFAKMWRRDKNIALSTVQWEVQTMGAEQFIRHVDQVAWEQYMATKDIDSRAYQTTGQWRQFIFHAVMDPEKPLFDPLAWNFAREQLYPNQRRQTPPLAIAS